MPTWITIMAGRLSNGHYYLYVNYLNYLIVDSITPQPLIATNGKLSIGTPGDLEFGLIQMWMNYELNYTNFQTFCINFNNIVSNRWY